MTHISLIQDLKSIKPKIDKLLEYETKKGGLRSLSGMFKSLRKLPEIDSVGDYPFLNFLLRNVALNFPGRIWSRNQVYVALKFCRFWEEEGRKQAYIPKEWEKYIKK